MGMKPPAESPSVQLVSVMPAEALAANLEARLRATLATLERCQASLANDAEHETADGGEVGRAVAIRLAAVVFVEGDVQNVMLRVLNRPVFSDGLAQLTRARRMGTDIKACLPVFVLTAGAAGGDRHERVQVAPAGALRMVLGNPYGLHDALFREPGRMTRNRALRIAKGVGLNRAKLEKDSEDKSVTRTLSENKRLARRLGIKGVPFYLVGDHVISSDSPDLYVALTDGVADIRKNGCRTGPCS